MAEADDARAPLTLTRVVLALALISLLAFVLPSAAVQRLHRGRVAAADREAAALARGVADALALSPGAVPSDVDLLDGPGARPAALDERWTTARALPLTRVMRQGTPPVDPWGNAYLVVAPSAARRAVWVLTAGPDGIIETPFPSQSLTPAGDDRAAASR